MNEREAARLVDYGHTQVVVCDDEGAEVSRGVAVSYQMVPMITVELADGTRLDAPLESVQLR